MNQKCRLASKANPFPGFGENLSIDSIRRQLSSILDTLKTSALDIFYLQAPDSQTPIEETLRACDELHKQGKFRELGLSNFPSWLVVHVYHICSSNGWVKPTVYQGLYNVLVQLHISYFRTDST